MNPNGAPAWLDWHTVFCEFGGSESAARIAYRKYNAGLMEPPANPFAAAYEDVLYGSTEFIDSHKQLLAEADADIDQRAKTVTVEQVMELVSKQFDVSKSMLRQPGRHRNFARDAAKLGKRNSQNFTRFAKKFGSNSVNESSVENANTVGVGSTTPDCDNHPLLSHVPH